MTTVLLILIGVLGFALMIFLHELGHFVSAKLSGVRVNEFAIGMGPKIIKFQKGETLYSLRLIPIGGFCAMEGEDGDSVDPKAFHRAKVWKRIIIIVMGAVMNLIFGFILMMVLQGQESEYTKPVISSFWETNTITEQAGLQVGDRFTNFDGYAIGTTTDLNFALSLAEMDGKETVNITVERDGEKVKLSDVALPQKNGMINLEIYVTTVEKTVFTLISHTFQETVSMVKLVWVSLAGMITGRFGLGDMAGPVGAVDMISQATGAGMKESFLTALNNLIEMLALISVNLGVVNLLPLPALDGGRLVFLIYEGIARKPFNRKYEGYVHAAGFALLMLLMVVLTFNDIVRIVTGG